MASTSQQFVNEVLRLTNEFRAKNGLAPLTANAELDQTAQKYSETMAIGDFFSHTGKDGSKPWDRAEDEGYQARTMGENIAAGQRSPKQVVDGWINSPGHRANMLNPNFTELGVGYFNLENDTGRVNYRTYWTQLFGSGDLLNNPAPQTAPPKPTNPQPTAPEPTLTPVVKLDFNAGEGAIAQDSSKAGRNNPASLRNGASWTAGKSGQAVAFDGQNDLVTMGGSADINWGTHDKYTVSMWFKVDDTAGGKQVIYEQGGGTRGLNAYVEDDLLYFGGWNRGRGESNWSGSWIKTNKVSSDKWHHIAVVLDGNNAVREDAMTAYLDGQIVGQAKGSQLWSHDIAGIGNVHNNTRFHDGVGRGQAYGLEGAVDGVQIFDGALSASQVQQVSREFI